MITITASQHRLATGFVQGILLYYLYKAVELAKWPATDHTAFACLLAVVIVVPLLKIINIGSMRPKTMIAWLLGVTVILAVLVMHDIYRRGEGLPRSAIFFNYFPSIPFMIFICAGIFIAQCLIAAGDAEHNYIASYPRYFDVAWKLAIQINFSISFVAVFWLVMWTGSSLLGVLHISFVRDIIRYSWFNIPATTTAMAYALHLTDVKPGLVRGIRTMKLTLLSWLLPLIVFFVVVFLLSIPTSGLVLLWATHHTSQIMLVTAAWVVILINAAYQDGTPEHTPPKILQFAGAIGAFTLLPLVAIAAWALSLRVEQYGWTVNLVEVAACIVVAACYAAGYFFAAFPRGAWLHRIEKTNIYTSFVILVVLVSLFTPVADPARLAVASQMARLKEGKVPSGKFDYAYLHLQGGVYGAEALTRLKAEATDPAEREKINVAIMTLPGLGYHAPPPPPPTPEEMAANIEIYPASAKLPATFTAQNWSSGPFAPMCLRNKNMKCDVFIIDKGKDTPPEVIVTYAKDSGGGMLYRFDGNSWAVAGKFDMELGCPATRQALRAGSYKMVPSTEEELDVNGTRIPIVKDAKTSCSPAAPAQTK